MTEKIIDGRYALTGDSAAGGTSSVLFAVRLFDGKKVALKRWNPSVPLESTVRETFLLNELKGRYLPAVEEYTMDHGQPVLVMEWRPGRTLERTVCEEKPFGDWETLLLGLNLSTLLRKMHGRATPVLYLDMKPSNVLVIGDAGTGRRRLEALLDFGCAREAKPDGSVCAEGFGTEGFAAPEQFIVGGQLTGETDVYSLAVTMAYAMHGTGQSRRLKRILDRAQRVGHRENRVLSMDQFHRELLSCLPECFFLSFGSPLSHRKLVACLFGGCLAGMLLLYTGREYRVFRERKAWEHEVILLLKDSTAEENRVRLLKLMGQTARNGETVREQLAGDEKFSERTAELLGDVFWYGEGGKESRLEACFWYSEADPKNRAIYEKLGDYYECLDSGKAASDEREGCAGEAARILFSRLKREGENAEHLKVTAGEFLRAVYAMGIRVKNNREIGELLKGAAVILKKAARSAENKIPGEGEEEKRETETIMEGLIQAAEELYELSVSGEE